MVGEPAVKAVAVAVKADESHRLLQLALPVAVAVAAAAGVATVQSPAAVVSPALALRGWAVGGRGRPRWRAPRLTAVHSASLQQNRALLHGREIDLCTITPLEI